jgi:hypothetical protein
MIIVNIGNDNIAAVGFVGVLVGGGWMMVSCLESVDYHR